MPPVLLWLCFSTFTLYSFCLRLFLLRSFCRTSPRCSCPWSSRCSGPWPFSHFCLGKTSLQALGSNREPLLHALFKTNRELCKIYYRHFFWHFWALVSVHLARNPIQPVHFAHNPKRPRIRSSVGHEAIGSREAITRCHPSSLRLATTMVRKQGQSEKSSSYTRRDTDWHSAIRGGWWDNGTPTQSSGDSTHAPLPAHSHPRRSCSSTNSSIGSRDWSARCAGSQTIL